MQFSRKSKKKEVLKELERVIHKPQIDSISMKEEFDKLESLKADLNNYAQALREPVGNFGRSPFNLFCIKESARRHFTKKNKNMPIILFASLESCTQEEWAEAISKLTDITELLPLIAPITNHPWRGCKPDIILPADEAEIEKLIDDCQTSLNNLENPLDRMAKICGVRRLNALEEISNGINAAKIIAESKPVDKNVLLNDEWNKPNEKAEALINKVDMFQAELPKVLDNFEATTIDQDVEMTLEKYRVLSQKFFRFFNSKYRQLKNDINALYKDKPPKNKNQIVIDLEQLTKCSKIREEIRKEYAVGHRFFGSHWKAENSDVLVLKSFAEWIVDFRRQLIAEILSERSVDLVSSGITRNQVLMVCKEVSLVVNTLIKQYNLLLKRIGANYQSLFNTQAKDVPFSDILSRLKLWKTELHKLQKWGQFVSFRDACLKTVSSPAFSNTFMCLDIALSDVS